MNLLLKWKGYHSEVKHFTLDHGSAGNGGCPCWECQWKHGPRKWKSNDVVDIFSLEMMWDRN
eukprot:5091017-Karenia_brevis.AAC.1